MARLLLLCFRIHSRLPGIVSLLKTLVNEYNSDGLGQAYLYDHEDNDNRYEHSSKDWGLDKNNDEGGGDDAPADEKVVDDERKCVVHGVYITGKPGYG